MKVKALITLLSSCNPDDDVIIWDGSNEGYGTHIGHLNEVINGRGLDPERMEPFEYVAILCDEEKKNR